MQKYENIVPHLLTHRLDETATPTRNFPLNPATPKHYSLPALYLFSVIDRDDILTRVMQQMYVGLYVRVYICMCVYAYACAHTRVRAHARMLDRPNS